MYVSLLFLICLSSRYLSISIHSKRNLENQNL